MTSNFTESSATELLHLHDISWDPKAVSLHCGRARGPILAQVNPMGRPGSRYPQTSAIGRVWREMYTLLEECIQAAGLERWALLRPPP